MSGTEAFAALDAAIAAASPADRPALVVALAGRLAALGAGMLTTEASAPAGDRNLDVPEIAARLGVSTAYVYRNLSSLPFCIRIGRRLLGSERGLEAFLARRRG